MKKFILLLFCLIQINTYSQQVLINNAYDIVVSSSGANVGESSIVYIISVDVDSLTLDTAESIFPQIKGNLDFVDGRLYFINTIPVTTMDSITTVQTIPQTWVGHTKKLGGMQCGIELIYDSNIFNLNLANWTLQ